MTKKPQPFTPETLVYGFTVAADPRISPDGMRILHTRSAIDRESKKPQSNLWTCAIDGSGATRLTWNGTSNTGVRWSPDGSAIAFISDRGEKHGIFVIPAQSAGEAREVTSHRACLSNQARSPDDTRDDNLGVPQT
jgi:Tol biopolymer transport system component